MARTAVPQTGDFTPDRSQRPRVSRRASRRVDHARRAEIGAERRLRTRVALLDAALELFGQEHGRATRIEDVCARAHVARGTFYNHFTGIEALLEALSDDLTRDFDDAVHGAFEAMKSPVERTCGAIRYYLHGAIQDPRWGWAMVNSSVRTILFGERVARRAQMTIQEGIDSGDFTIESAVVGRDILLGAGLSGTLSLLHGGTPVNYPEKVARQLLLSLGVSKAVAAAATRKPIRDLPSVAPSSRYFRGTLGRGTSSKGPNGKTALPRKRRGIQ